MTHPDAPIGFVLLEGRMAWHLGKAITVNPYAGSDELAARVWNAGYLRWDRKDVTVPRGTAGVSRRRQGKGSAKAGARGDWQPADLALLRWHLASEEALSLLTLARLVRRAEGAVKTQLSRLRKRNSGGPSPLPSEARPVAA